MHFRVRTRQEAANLDRGVRDETGVLFLLLKQHLRLPHTHTCTPPAYNYRSGQKPSTRRLAPTNRSTRYPPLLQSVRFHLCFFCRPASTTSKHSAGPAFKTASLCKICIITSLFFFSFPLKPGATARGLAIGSFFVFFFFFFFEGREKKRQRLGIQIRET